MVGKTTAAEANFIKNSLEALSRRPVKHRFDVGETGNEEFLGLPAASRPFALKTGIEEEGAATFSVTVKALKGNTAPTAVMGLSSFDSVDALKAKAAIALDVDKAALRLVFKGKALSAGSKTLADYALGAGAVVHVMVTAPSSAASASGSNTAAGPGATKTPADTLAAVGASKEFWAELNAVVSNHMTEEGAGAKENSTKVFNAFVTAYTGLIPDSNKTAQNAVKKHSRK